MATTYTIDELLALPDGELNALAAELRGWYIGGLLGKEEIDVWCTGEKSPHDSYKRQIRVADWQPATSRDQSGELLESFVETQRKGCYAVRSGKLFRSVSIQAATTGDDVNVSVPGSGAKEQTVAFCAAMLAIQETK